MIKYSTIKELRFLREDTYVIYYVGSSVGSFVVVVFLRVTLCSVFVLRLLCFFLFFLPSVICTFFLSRVVLILLKYCVMLWLDRAVMVSSKAPGSSRTRQNSNFSRSIVGFVLCSLHFSCWHSCFCNCFPLSFVFVFLTFFLNYLEWKQCLIVILPLLVENFPHLYLI